MTLSGSQLLLPEEKPKSVKASAFRPKGSYWRTKADIIWRECMYLLHPVCPVRDHGRCSRILNAHHVISRSVGSLRHQLENGMSLCVTHHHLSHDFSAHGAPLQFHCWFQEHSPEQYEWARLHLHQVGKYDYRAAAHRLLDEYHLILENDFKAVWKSGHIVLE